MSTTWVTGQEAELDGKHVVIEGYSKGWYTVKDDEGNITKTRGKELSFWVGPVEETEETEGVESGEMEEVSCPACEHTWWTARSTNLCCPKCKHWFIIRLRPKRENYVRGLGITASGNDTYDIGDETADMLRGLSENELYATAGQVVFELGPEKMSKSFNKSFKGPWDATTIANYFAEKYGSLNSGMARMNIGNIIRVALRK